MKMPNSESVEPDHNTRGFLSFNIGTKIVLTFSGFILLLCACLLWVYNISVPPLVNEQVNKRMSTLASTFQSTATAQIITRNYLALNHSTEVAAQQDGIAYVLVINERRFPIAAISSPAASKLFSESFSTKIATEGFSDAFIASALSDQSSSEERLKNGSFTERVHGDRRIRELVVPIGHSTGSFIIIGMFLDEIDLAVSKAFLPLIALMIVIGTVGLTTLVFISRTITRPIKQLTIKAHQLGEGHLDQPVKVRGGSDVLKLASSLETFRISALTNQQLKEKQLLTLCTRCPPGF